MKNKNLIAALLFAFSVVSSCTVQMGTPQAKALRGHVLVSAPRPTKGLVKAHKPPRGTSRAVMARAVGAPPRARDLSASTDITSMTYSVIDTGSNGEATITSSIDPSYPYIDLFLTPGESYRIVVDVAITATAPGTNVGVTRYGDQADFTVDPNYDTYVSLTVHPSKMIVFDPSSVPLPYGATVAYYDPADGSKGTKTFFNSNETMSSADKFFYSPDAKLYYFNRTDNAVYQWPNIKSAMTSGNMVLDGTKQLASDGAVQIYAACSDPTTQSTLWVVGYDITAATWNYYQVDVSTSTPSVSYTSPDISSDLSDGLTPTLIQPTGIAVDSTFQDVNITFVTTDGTNVDSGLLDYFSGPPTWTTFPSASPMMFSGGTTSIYTDVSWDQGKLWVLASPNVNFGTGLFNQGRADILTFDDSVTPLTTFPTPLHVDYTGLVGSRPNVSTPNILFLPNRFAGPAQGNLLYVSQLNPYPGTPTGYRVLSQVDMSANTVTDVDTKSLAGS